MQQQSWLLPDGIVELTGAAAQELEHIRRHLLDMYQSWGYSLIFPPIVEFLDNLIAGGSEDLALQTFKLTDQVSGRMLGIRADITPQVARHDAYHNTGDVNRLCYAGSVLHTKAHHILANRSLVQAGAELYGHQDTASDLEILELLLNSLPMTGPTDLSVASNQIDPWTVTIGHAGITRALINAIDIPIQCTSAILKALKSKSEPDLIELSQQFQLQTRQTDALLELTNLCGDISVLNKLAQRVPEHQQACQSLENIHAACQQQYAGIRWFFDFSSVNNYAYETGITFHATHAKSAEPLARGGRYDSLSRMYGAERPAVGFSCDLLALAKYATHDKAQAQPQRIWAPSFAQFTNTVQDQKINQALRQMVQRLRSEGKAVTTSVHQSQWQNLDPSIQEKYDYFLTFDQHHWQIKQSSLSML